MPIYEYQCHGCKRRTSIFARSVSPAARGVCEHCGGGKLSRVMSKFAVHGGRVNLDDPSSMGGIDESDPRAVARLMRQMGEETDEAMEPGFEEMLGRMEAGESPESAMAGSALDDDFAGDDGDF